MFVIYVHMSWQKVQLEINLVETPIGLSTGRNSNQVDLGTALGSEI